MPLGEASVKIVPDVSGFAAQVTKDINAALSGVGKVAEKTGQDIKDGIGSGLKDVVKTAEKTGEGLKDGITSGLKDIDKAVDKSADNLGTEFKDSSKKAETAVAGIDDKVKQVGKTIAAAFVSAQLVSFIKNSIAAAEGAEQTRRRLDQVATSMGVFGKEVKQVTDRLAEYASTVSRQTGIDDDSIIAAQTKLLVFKSLSATADQMGGAFDRTTKAALDLSAAGFGSMEGMALRLGKALENPLMGMNGLTKIGVTFTAEQKKMIQTLVETNRVAAAQEMILAAVEQRVGGTAESTATASMKMRVAYDELQESIGAALLPTFESLANALIPLLDGFGKLPAELRSTVTLITASTAITSAFSKTLQGLGVSAKIAGTAMGLLNAAFIAYSLYQQQEANNQQNFAKLLDMITTATDDQIETMKEQVKIFIALSDYSPEQSFRMLAESALGAAQRLVDAGQAQELFGISTSAATLIIGEQIRAQQIANKNIEDTQRVMDNAAKSTERSTAQLEAYVEGLGFVIDESGDLEMSQENMSKAIEFAQKRFDDATKAVDDYKRSIEDAFAAARSSIDTGFALVESQLESADALKEYEKAAKKSSTTAEELDKIARQTAKTMLTNADNAVANAEALAKMQGATLDAKQTQDIYRESLLNFMETINPSSPLYQYLNGIIQTLDSVPTDIPIELTTEVDTAKTELEMFNDTAAQMGYTIGNQITVGILRALAPLSPEFKKMLDKMLYEAGRDIAVNVRLNVTASGQTYVTSPYGATPVGSTTVSSMTSTAPTTTTSAKTLADLNGLLSFAVGGIVDNPQFALIGEAGREAVIPLTRPGRALELMRESGLLGLAQAATSSGQNFDITVVSAEPMRTAKDVVREFQALEYRMGPL